MTTDNLPGVAILTNGREREETPPGTVIDLYRDALPTLDFLTEQTKVDPAMVVRPQDLHLVLETGLRNPDISLTFLRNMTAVDWEDAGLEVVYHLFSLRHHHGLAVKAMLPSDSPSLQSVTDLFRTAEWMEREAREMFGIEFEGLADARNLLLDEDIDIHPLLKSHPLAEIETKQGDDVSTFTKAHPPPKREEDDAAKVKAAAAAAAKPKPARKSLEDMTEEERAERKTMQAERVTRGRELAAARRAAGPPGADKTREPAAEAEQTTTEATETEAAEAAPAPRPRPSPAAAATGGGALTDEEKAERVIRGRELAAARREELRKERGE
jgi:NADH-quinone oxidoreductase subunit C